MTRIKVVKTLIATLMAAVVLGACSEYYPNIGSYDYTHGLPEISNQETGGGRIPIVLYINEQSIFGLTRGVGAFEDTTKNILVTLKNEPKTFSADKEYKVKVLIKGLEEPEIYARPIGWGDGGDIYLEEN